MKLAKIILALVIVGLIAAGGFILTKGKHDSTRTQDDEFIEYRQGKRGDDPLYSEEIKKNAALTLSTRDRQVALEQKVQQDLSNFKSDAQRQTSDALQKIQTLQAQLQKMKEEQSVDAVQQAVDDKMKALTETISTLNQTLQDNAKASAKKIAQLEQRLAEKVEQSSSELVSTPDFLQDKDKSSTEIVPKPEKPNRRIQYPYGTNGQGLVQQQQSSQDNLLQRLNKTFNNTLSGSDELFYDTNSDQHNGPLPEVAVKAKKEGEWETVFPVYTLPPNTLLADSTLITPIIGRVPNLNKGVSDPYFFKVEIGADNIAANGHNIPGIAKMIASGYSTGVREQSCVRGYIDSLTFVFIDGRIVTHGKASGQGQSSGQALGYLADRWGKPCIRGQYINNGKDYLSSRGLAAFLEAAAEGLSQSQVKQTEDENGNRQAILDGNIWHFIFGRGVGGSAREIADYVRERAMNAVDLVYVEQGRSVQIFLDSMIPIDYDSKARKINYYAKPTPATDYD